MDHMVTKTQKELLSAFGIDTANGKIGLKRWENVEYRGKQIW